MRIEGEEKNNTILDDNAFLYQKREDKTAKARFKDLQGKEKWQFFRDYLLLRMLAVIGGAVLLVSLLISIFKPKPDCVMHLAVIDCPLSIASQEKFGTALMGALITDPAAEETILDTDFYVSTDDYNARMKLITLLAAGEIDAILLTKNELINYNNAECFSPLTEVMSSESLSRYSDYALYLTPEYKDSDPDGIIYGENAVYAIDVTDCIAAINGYEQIAPYYLACAVTTKHPASFEKTVDLFFSYLISEE